MAWAGTLVAGATSVKPAPAYFPGGLGCPRTAVRIR
jgi:hypothetical protein